MYFTYFGIPYEKAIKTLNEIVLPPTAYKPIQKIAGGGLTDINPDHTKYAFSKVFGPYGLGWSISYDSVDIISPPEAKDTVAVTKGFALDITLFDEDNKPATTLRLPVEGGGKNNRVAWAIKGALTSAITTALQLLLGMNYLVFTNVLTPEVAQQKREEYVEEHQEPEDPATKLVPDKNVLVPEGLPDAGKPIYQLNPKDDTQMKELKYLAGMIQNREGHFFSGDDEVKTAAFRTLVG